MKEWTIYKLMYDTSDIDIAVNFGTPQNVTDYIVQRITSYSEEFKNFVRDCNLKGITFDEEYDLVLLQKLPRHLINSYEENSNPQEILDAISINVKMQVPTKSQLMHEGITFAGEYAAKIVADTIRNIIKKYIGEELLKCISIRYKLVDTEVTLEEYTEKLYYSIGSLYYMELMKDDVIESEEFKTFISPDNTKENTNNLLDDFARRLSYVVLTDITRSMSDEEKLRTMFNLKANPESFDMHQIIHNKIIEKGLELSKMKIME